MDRPFVMEFKSLSVTAPPRIALLIERDHREDEIEVKTYVLTIIALLPSRIQGMHIFQNLNFVIFN